MAMADRPASPVLSIGSRIKARLSRATTRRRRRHSGAPSMASSRSDASASTAPPSQLPEGSSSLSSSSAPAAAAAAAGRHRDEQHQVGDDRRNNSSDYAVSGSDGGPVVGGGSGRSSSAHEAPNGAEACTNGDDAAANTTNIDALDVKAGNGGAGGVGGSEINAAGAGAGANPGAGGAAAAARSGSGSGLGSTASSSGSGGSTGSTASSASLPPVSPTRRHLTKDLPGNDLRQSSSLQPSSTLHSIHEDSASTPSNSSSSAQTPDAQHSNDDDDLDQDPLSPTLPSVVVVRPRAGAGAGAAASAAAAAARPASVAVDSPSSASGSPFSFITATTPPEPPQRRQSLLPNRQVTLIKTLLHSPNAHDDDPQGSGLVLPINANMVTRKIWVRRPGASPTLVTINEDDLVDDVRDLILRKYANSLGRTFDSPDLALRICPREQQKDRLLGPEEPISRTLDAYFPGGQTVEEALVIDVPRRTPKPSPRAPIPHAHGATAYYVDDGRPSETGEGYFPPVGGGVPSPHLPLNLPAATNGTVPHSIAVLGTGHIPPIPSPGGTRSRAYRDRPERPRLGRTHTSSPTILNNATTSIAAAAAAGHVVQQYAQPRLPRSRTQSNASDQTTIPPPAAPLPSSPAHQEPPPARVATPPPRVASPRPSSSRPKKIKKADHPSLPPGMLNNSVPPISVLIVEDNPINLKLLEAFVKRLKVRWQTAMNGKDAVAKWRTGGFHLVLMDIQLPVMNGLEATREIRRLERVNSIGVFSLSPSSVPDEEVKGELHEQDRLENPGLFKSPVIIVALTASSLQSDRHEALAAGCNDFLTKPVNFVWLERKVMEWGCMQALIDFDGWRKWKDFTQQKEEEEASKKAAAAAKAKSKKNRSSLSLTTGA